MRVMGPCPKTVAHDTRRRGGGGGVVPVFSGDYINVGNPSQRWSSDRQPLHKLAARMQEASGNVHDLIMTSAEPADNLAFWCFRTPIGLEMCSGSGR